jgi:hypothetical protein
MTGSAYSCTDAVKITQSYHFDTLSVKLEETYFTEEEIAKGTFMDKVQDCVFIEFDLDHMSTAEFPAFGEGVD